MLDLDAAIHHDVEPRRQRDGGGLVVFDAQLHPQTVGADGDRFVGDRRNVAATAKAVDHLNAQALGAQGVCRLGQTGVDRLAQNLLARVGGLRVDRHDAIAVLLHVARRGVTRPIGPRRQAHDADDAIARQNLPQSFNGFHANAAPGPKRWLDEFGFRCASPVPQMGAPAYGGGGTGRPGSHFAATHKD